MVSLYIHLFNFTALSQHQLLFRTTAVAWNTMAQFAARCCEERWCSYAVMKKLKTSRKKWRMHTSIFKNSKKWASVAVPTWNRCFVITSSPAVTRPLRNRRGDKFASKIASSCVRRFAPRKPRSPRPKNSKSYCFQCVRLCPGGEAKRERIV